MVKSSAEAAAGSGKNIRGKLNADLIRVKKNKDNKHDSTEILESCTGSCFDKNQRSKADDIPDNEVNTSKDTDKMGLVFLSE